MEEREMMQISVSLNKKRAIEENETVSGNQKCFYKADNQQTLSKVYKSRKSANRT